MRKLENFYVETLNDNWGYFFRAEKKLFEKQTSYQFLEVLEFPYFGRVLRLDGIFQTSYFDEMLYHEALAHVPGISLGGPKTALVIGGGDGGMIEELLKYNSLEKVVMVELDKDVVDASKQYLPAISNGAFEDPRLTLLFEDGVKYIKNTKEKFDQVILDLTDPFGPSVALYTQEFYTSIANILTERGCLSLHVESPLSRPDVYARLIATLKSVFQYVNPMFNYVPLYGTLWGYASASQMIHTTAISKDEVQKRINQLGLKNLRFYNQDTHFSLQAVPNYIEDLLKQKLPPYTEQDMIQLNDEISQKKLILAEE
ncbi:MAG: polyamine aminopropyltransferase [Candidatus Hydrogenedentota bacterium]|nr:MAG: polyamine aminopropyltransferase [Candidatus Hydrogenedentota bacterium]